MSIEKIREEMAKRAAAYEKDGARSENGPRAAVMMAAEPDMTSAPVVAAPSGAREFYATLKHRIASIEARLRPVDNIELIHDVPDGHCVIEQIGYQGDDMMVFSGHLASGRRCSVFVHVHAVNLCLTVAPLPPGETRQPIAFKADAAHDL